MIDLEQLLGPDESAVAVPLPPQAMPVVRIPKYIDLIPDQLAVRVFAHEVQVGAQLIPCWSYVTDGLRHMDQKEIILTLRRHEDEDEKNFPADPLSFFTDLFSIAQKGRNFEVGSFTRVLLRKPFFGFSDQIGFAYVSPVPLKGVHWPSPPIAAIFLHPEEVKAVARIGTYRVLGLLGQQGRHYPHPFWSERNRSTVLQSEDLNKSLLSRVPIAAIPGVTVVRQSNSGHIDTLEHPRHGRIVPENSPLGHWVTLQVEEESISKIKQALDSLPPEAPLAILTGPSSKSNARLVWRADNGKTQTITRNGSDQSTLTGGSMLLLADDGFREGAAIVEDGFVLRMSKATWKSLREALRQGQPWMLPALGTTALGFSLEWDFPGKVKFLAGMAYQSEETLRNRVTSEVEFSQFVRQAEQVVQKVIGAQRARSGCAVTLTMLFQPDAKLKVWIEGLSSDLTDPITQKLQELPQPRITGGPVAYSLLFHLWDGPLDDDEKCPWIPDEWIKHVAAAGGVTEDLLKKMGT